MVLEKANESALKHAFIDVRFPGQAILFALTEAEYLNKLFTANCTSALDSSINEALQEMFESVSCRQPYSRSYCVKFMIFKIFPEHATSLANAKRAARKEKSFIKQSSNLQMINVAERILSAMQALLDTNLKEELHPCAN